MALTSAEKCAKTCAPWIAAKVVQACEGSQWECIFSSHPVCNAERAHHGCWDSLWPQRVCSAADPDAPLQGSQNLRLCVADAVLLSAAQQRAHVRSAGHVGQLSD